MTTTSDVLQPRPTARVAGPPRTLPRFLLAFVAGLVLCLGVAGIALYAWDASYAGRVLPGVRVGGVDLSGLDDGQAAAALSTAYRGWGDGRVVIRTVAGEVTVPFADAARRPDLDAMVSAAMASGRSGGPLERAVGQVRLALDGTSLEPRLVLDEAALRARIADALEALEVAPRDATIALTPTGIRWDPSRPGRTFDAGPVQAAAFDALRRTDAPGEVVLDAPAGTVAPGRSDAVVLAAKAATERVIADVVVAHGRQSWTIPTATVRGWVTLSIAPDGSVWPELDHAAIAPALGDIAHEVRQKAVSATFLTGSSGAIVGVKAGRDGRRLDVDATAASIAEALESRAAGAPPASVRAAVTVVEPELTTSEAEKLAPRMVRLSRWTTWFPIGERNNWGANIWLPARYINGTVLGPGERFEWWSRVGPITAARGFGMGGVIKGDHTEPTGAIGGGMCSSSTTLFNAALRAGLKMGARSNHRYYIERYPLGLDATVSGSQTMSFTNDMDTPVLVRGYRIVGRGGVGYVRYEIWGVPDGRTVRLSRPRVWNVERPGTDVVYVDSLRTGVRRQTEWPMRGMDVSVTRVVRDRDGRVIRRDTFVSHYTVWNARFEVGR